MPRAGARSRRCPGPGTGRVDDELDGLGAVGELDHGHESEERDHERRDAGRPQPRHDAGRRAAAPRRAGVLCRPSVENSSAETANVAALATKAAGAEANASRSAPIAGTDHDSEVLHGVEQAHWRARADLLRPAAAAGPSPPAARRFLPPMPARRCRSPARRGHQPATTAARTSMSTRRSRLPTTSTVRRG